MSRKMKETKTADDKISSISIGSTFTYQDNKGVDRTYTICANSESDLAKGTISPFSPLAQAVIGKKEGNKATVKAPIGSYNIKIIRVGKGAKT